jgi:hypothetical protein
MQTSRKPQAKGDVQVPSNGADFGMKKLNREETATAQTLRAGFLHKTFEFVRGTDFTAATCGSFFF